MNRIRSLQDFWPHYLSEHRSTVSRRLHFVGTTGFLISVAASAALHPIRFPLALAGMVGLGVDAARRVEKDKRPTLHVLSMIALPTLAAPLTFPAGVVCAYGFAWAGHFGFEKNRPATFHYPVWSLASDFRMYSHMLRGRLWSGDPLEELGLEVPSDKAEEETRAAAK